MHGLRERLRRAGFAFVEGGTMRRELSGVGSLDDWGAFAASWERLGEDPYLARVGRRRRRRHGVFTIDPRLGVTRAPDRPHYQSPEYNPLQGGIHRRFEPLEPAVGRSASLRTILRYGAGLFGGLLDEPPTWEVEVHQFRIEATADAAGAPTPEGMHRDGVDHVLVLLIERVNIREGETSIHHVTDGRRLGAFTLAAPFDAALVDDRRALHAVTPVEPVDPARPAHRDVLVVTHRARA
jgi:hypothetical protein